MGSVSTHGRCGANVSVKWLSVMCPVIDWRLFQGMFCLSSDVRWARLEFTVTLNSIGGEENEIALPHYCQFCCRSPAPPNRMWMASCRGHLILGLHRLLLCLGHKGPCCALPRRRISALGHLPSPFCFLHLFISLGFKCVIAGGGCDLIWQLHFGLVMQVLALAKINNRSGGHLILNFKTTYKPFACPSKCKSLQTEIKESQEKLPSVTMFPCA